MKKNKKGKSKKRGPSPSMFQEPILETMRKSPDRALNYKQIAKRIGVTDTQERNALAQNLNRMKNDGLLREVERGKYRLKHMPAPKLIGKVDMTSTGAAYVTVEGYERDIYISPRKVRQALPGDIVKVHAYSNHKGNRVEGEIVEVVERAKETFVGTLSINT
ncbi:MAG TPA: ribonuclease R, partial [Flavobacteriales bacterium]|nr:ribonuclease R [Flavobacteriales bacterium]